MSDAAAEIERLRCEVERAALTLVAALPASMDDNHDVLALEKALADLNRARAAAKRAAA